MMREWLQSLLLLVAIVGAMLAIAAIFPGCAARTLVELHDRDMESWAGYRLGDRIALDRAQLSVLAEQAQRFNPAVYASRTLSNVNLYLTFPAAISISPSAAWIRQRADADGQTLSGHLGTINAGERISNREALHITAPHLIERFEIAYIITARELRDPVRGRLVVAVQSDLAPAGGQP